MSIFDFFCVFYLLVSKSDKLIVLISKMIDVYLLMQVKEIKKKENLLYHHDNDHRRCRILYLLSNINYFFSWFFC